MGAKSSREPHCRPTRASRHRAPSGLQPGERPILPDGHDGHGAFADGGGHAFAGAVAFAMAQHWAWPDALRFANAVAALSTRAVGAQTALPSIDEALALLGYDPRSLPH